MATHGVGLAPRGKISLKVSIVKVPSPKQYAVISAVTYILKLELIHLIRVWFKKLLQVTIIS